jgi:hypothetical protein
MAFSVEWDKVYAAVSILVGMMALLIFQWYGSISIEN